MERGFLTNTIEHLRPQAKTTQDLKLSKTRFGGRKKAPAHMLAMTNVMLHALMCLVTFCIQYVKSSITGLWPEGSGDIIFTNSAFGGMEEDGIETNFREVSNAGNGGFIYGVDYAFAAACWGQGAVVLPDGFCLGRGRRRI